MDAVYASKRYSSSDGERETSPFTVVNAKIIAKPCSGVTLEAGVQNLFDKNYALTEGFPEPGRSFFANAAYTF